MQNDPRLEAVCVQLAMNYSPHYTWPNDFQDHYVVSTRKKAQAILEAADEAAWCFDMEKAHEADQPFQLAVKNNGITTVTVADYSLRGSFFDLIYGDYVSGEAIAWRPMPAPPSTPEGEAK